MRRYLRRETAMTAVLVLPWLGWAVVKRPPMVVAWQMLITPLVSDGAGDMAPSGPIALPAQAAFVLPGDSVAAALDNPALTEPAK